MVSCSVNAFALLIVLLFQFLVISSFNGFV